MKAFELMNQIYFSTPILEPTCDTLKWGNPEKILQKVAVTCIATAEVITRAQEWGADLLITHEPTFFDHWEQIEAEDPVVVKKRKLLEQSDMAIYRYHDGIHLAEPDGIAEGELHFLGVKGSYTERLSLGINRFLLEDPMSAGELKELMEERLGLQHIRVCGNTTDKCTRLALCFGAPGEGLFQALRSPETEIAVCGETCEWRDGEYVRDAAYLGEKKALLILGHMGSERDGMKLLAQKLAREYEEFETKYFECGEVY